MTTSANVLPDSEKVHLGPVAARLKGLGLAAGVVCLAAAILWGAFLGDDMRRFMHAYLLAFTYFLSFALGGLFFVLLHHLVGAHWSVVVRRLAEILTGAFPVLFVLMLGLVIPLLFGNKSLYTWNDPSIVAGNHALEAKAGYLNAPFFAIRLLVYFAVWMGLSRYLLKKSVEHYQDLGKMVNSFTLFWAYIGFAQFMLIWAANVPEEEGWYRIRMFTEWKWVSLVLIVGNFCVPFVGMMSRHIKRNPPVLAGWCLYMLVMHLIDLYWVVMPSYSPDKVVVHPIDFLCLIGVGGLFLFGALGVAGSVRLIPVRDPKLGQSLKFINQ